jgi:hypothetical protein
MLPVVASRQVSVQPEMQEVAEMPSVGFARRVVDHSLPAGVSTVAAGPLVVFSLILDAILAAGALMLLPWVALLIYVAALLIPNRQALLARLERLAEAGPH